MKVEKLTINAGRVVEDPHHRAPATFSYSFQIDVAVEPNDEWEAVLESMKAKLEGIAEDHKTAVIHAYNVLDKIADDNGDVAAAITDFEELVKRAKNVIDKERNRKSGVIQRDYLRTGRSEL
jgi:hypothetical protein